MGSFLVFVSVLAFLGVACAVPAWEYVAEEDSLSPSSVELSGRHCSCSEHHHQCGCCLHIKAHAFHKSIDANVCMNASYVPSPLGVEMFMTWNDDLVFNKTISTDNLPPICFGIPHLKVAKACAKFSNISIERGHTGACVTLEVKAFQAQKDFPLGCFFFRRGDEGHGLDIGTFLDSKSLMLLLGNLFQDAVGNMIDRTNSLDYTPYNNNLSDDVTELLTVDQARCQCTKNPPQCDCCAQVRIFRYPLKACVHTDIDQSGQGFNIAVVVNGFTVFRKHISVPDPPPICKRFRVSGLTVNACLMITNVSLTPGHVGACVELDINSMKFSLGCFYMAR